MARKTGDSTMTKVIVAVLSATLLLGTGSATFAASKKRPAHTPAATVSIPRTVSPELYNARAEARTTLPVPQRTSEPLYFTYATGGDNG
jgi:hypothetical protein